jgi:hypothetical protein
VITLLLDFLHLIYIYIFIRTYYTHKQTNNKTKSALYIIGDKEHYMTHCIEDYNDRCTQAMNQLINIWALQGHFMLLYCVMTLDLI